jgi:Planctomycete cytochrome C
VTRFGILWWVAFAALAGDPERDAARYFDTRVAPILSRRCLGCHNEELKNGTISFLDRDSLIRGGSRGPTIVPGKPQESVLMDVLRHDGEIQMPPGPKLPAKEIAVLAEWIRRGSIWGAKLRK